MATDERSFIMIKPDGVQRGLVGEIIKRFEQKGFTLKGLKLMNVSVRTSPNRSVCTRNPRKLKCR